MEKPPPDAALLIIDVQKAIDDPRWHRIGPRNNPQAEANIATLLAVWRAASRPIVHIRHDSRDPASSYSADGPGHPFKDEAMPLPGETVIAKQVNSAFIGTGLDDWLRGRGIGTLVVAGVITNNSVEATVRMAGNLGYDVRLVADACFTFARLDRSGRLRTAEEVHDLSLANMDGEYATVVETAQVSG
ncbi:cysteine hydrolase [Azospirillum sp. YIM B02556]|uniref:Cysteine hydrolase n=1 Tax=Azospirillum endophyticum TaxID=2800326 RepID=A0ABS1F2W8_9PROT|nr:cysteine hydrolase family protein [Azospirillum endophyticum]MBK1837755.1 cysteine hydrolase [Azospirillum endophyticum]